MPSQRAERIARNESVFRELNESLERSVHRGRPDSDFAGFVCECGNVECDETVRVDLPAYERVRQDSQQFILVPGHDAPDVESVVDRSEGYVVVRKHVEVGPIVEQTDPRRERR